MAEIKKFKPSTKEKPKPEKPAEVVDIESGREKKKMRESVDTSTVLADIIELIREGHLSDAEIDDLRSITENEKTLLKVVSGLFERLRKYDEEVEELRGLIRHLQEEEGREQK